MVLSALDKFIAEHDYGPDVDFCPRCGTDDVHMHGGWDGLFRAWRWTLTCHLCKVTFEILQEKKNREDKNSGSLSGSMSAGDTCTGGLRYD